MSDLLRSAGRTRALLDGIVALLFAVLVLYVTIRMIWQGAETFGVILIAALTAGLWWRAWRSFRRFRVLSQTPPESGGG